MKDSIGVKLSILDLIIVVLSIYVLIALVADTFFILPGEISNLLAMIDDGICIIFLIEFSVRFYRAESKLSFMKWGWIDLISSIPALPVARCGRVFRLIRLLRVLRAFRSTRILVKHVFKNRVKGTMTSVVILAFLVVIFSSISILIVEKSPDSNIKTSGDALWWAIVTVTTVGYGDKYPVTTEGRIIGSLLMFVGVGLFGSFTGFLATWFIEKHSSDEEDKSQT